MTRTPRVISLEPEYGPGASRRLSVALNALFLLGATGLVLLGLLT